MSKDLAKSLGKKRSEDRGIIAATIPRNLCLADDAEAVGRPTLFSSPSSTRPCCEGAMSRKFQRLSIVLSGVFDRS
jgi:hypothetical protein